MFSLLLKLFALSPSCKIILISHWTDLSAQWSRKINCFFVVVKIDLGFEIQFLLKCPFLTVFSKIYRLTKVDVLGTWDIYIPLNRKSQKSTQKRTKKVTELKKKSTWKSNVAQKSTQKSKFTKKRTQKSN